jgi:GTPase
VALKSDARKCLLLLLLLCVPCLVVAVVAVVAVVVSSLLLLLLSLLPCSHLFLPSLSLLVAADEDAGFVQIDSVFQVPGAGTVVAGCVLRGRVRVGEMMLLGPDPTGDFVQVCSASCSAFFFNCVVLMS